MKLLLVFIGVLFIWNQPLIASKFITNSVPQDVKNYKGKCPKKAANSCPYISPIINETCEVLEFNKIGDTKNKPVFFSQYKRKINLDFGTLEKSEPYLCTSIESYILEGTSKTTVRPIWLNTIEESFGLSNVEGASMHHIGDESILVVQFFTGGTGGYYEHHYILIHGHWAELQKDNSWKTAYDKLPKGYRPHKSEYINLDTMVWKQNFANKNDPNCCPSLSIKYQLSIKNQKLHVENFKIIKDNN